MPRRIATIVPFILILAIGLITWAFLAPSVPAAPNFQETPTGEPETAQATPVPNLSLSDDYCLSCHGQPGQTFELENGETLDLFVDPAWHTNSVHGRLGYACVQCHTDVGVYPHPAFQAADRRDATLQMNGLCQRCHDHQFELAQDDVHANAQAAGVREAAVCIDCHTAHEVRRLNDPVTREPLPDARPWIPERCALCHSEIYQKYHESVHGAALSEGDRNVPTCIDCHGVHNIENPTTAYFRLRSPQICAECHTNPSIMAQYGISTDVLETYVADFHGTTIAIFEKQSPDAAVNQAVCYDCHGIHDISRPDDPQTGIQMKSNLLVRCQNCHPDADENFPSAWMSHYKPSPENYPVVYWVDVFYKFFIPTVLGGMGALVVLDAGRKVLNRRQRRKPQGGALAADLPAESTPAPAAVDADPGSQEVDPGEQPATFAATEQPPDLEPPVAPPLPDEPTQPDDPEVSHG